jgi:hypothetical protein
MLRLSLEVTLKIIKSKTYLKKTIKGLHIRACAEQIIPPHDQVMK